MVFLLNSYLLEAFLTFCFPSLKEVVYPRIPMIVLFLDHIVIVSLSSLGAIICGISIGIFVTRKSGEEFQTLFKNIGAIAQTFPPVAVLALAIPFLGFGFWPVVVALFLYGILPILNNTISGISSVSIEVFEAAKGLGMGRIMILLKIELPLASQVIMAGVRTSVVINIGTATIGAVVGAGGLGVPIVAGLVRYNSSFVVQGALGAAVLALSVDLCLKQIIQALTKKYKF